MTCTHAFNKKNIRAFTLVGGAAHCNMSDGMINQCALKLAERSMHTDESAKLGRCAFTLAEVLIALGIIGIVAAMTIPTLMQSYKKKVTVVRLKKFYSTMIEATKLSWQEHGPSEYWEFTSNEYTGQGLQTWFKEYFSDVKIVSEKANGKYYYAALADGSGFVAYVSTSTTTTLFFFYCIEYKNCAAQSFDGVKTFLFTLYNGKFITSLPTQQSFTREQLLNACKYGNTDNSSVSSKGRRHACTRLIETDGWTIADDYPWQQTMLEN